MKETIFLLFGVFFLLVSCTSPENDGRKAAQLCREAENVYYDYCESEFSNFIKEFKTENYTSRVEVRKELSEITKKAENLKNEKLHDAEAFYKAKSDKYITNQKKNAEFEYAYNAYREISQNRNTNLLKLEKQLESLIQTIIPPKPDIDKIKGDLVGRTVSGVDGSYLSGNWYWIIDNCEQIKEAYVTYETQISDSYKYEVHLVLQSEGGKYAVNANLYYVLGDRDDWTLELLESKSVEVVKTGQYDSCITSKHTGWIGEYEVTFTNTCDVPLIVGGLIKYEYRNGWKKFCITVDANGTKSIGGLFFGSISDYKIEFVERL